MHAPPGGGEFVTKPLRFSGNQLILNYATSAVGSLQVEIQDEAGQPLADFAIADCEPLYGNELDAPMRWKGGDLSEHADKPVRLRFVMKDSDVYTMRFDSIK